jgi:hypothetical protein
VWAAGLESTCASASFAKVSGNEREKEKKIIEKKKKEGSLNLGKRS